MTPTWVAYEASCQLGRKPVRIYCFGGEVWKSVRYRDDDREPVDIRVHRRIFYPTDKPLRIEAVQRYLRRRIKALDIEPDCCCKPSVTADGIDRFWCPLHDADR